MQAALVARWMQVGFIHGVMNTDNVTISGETIDYGPCAFMEQFDPATVFSSIDHGGRYAYGNQPMITQWNLARLAESLLPLHGDDTDAAIARLTALLESFPERFTRDLDAGMRRKLGLDGLDVDATLSDEFLGLLHAQSVDMTSAFRSLSRVLRGEAEPARSLFAELAAFDDWSSRWQATVARRGLDGTEVADGMDLVNPLVIPRNHVVEDALDAATAGDLAPFEQLLDAVLDPYTDRPGLDPRYTRPAPADAAPHVLTVPPGDVPPPIGATRGRGTTTRRPDRWELRTPAGTRNDRPEGRPLCVWRSECSEGQLSVVTTSSSIGGGVKPSTPVKVKICSPSLSGSGATSTRIVWPAWNSL